VDGSENESDDDDEALPELLDIEHHITESKPSASSAANDTSLPASHTANISDAAPVHGAPSSTGVPQSGPASAQSNGQSHPQSNAQPQGPFWQWPIGADLSADPSTGKLDKKSVGKPWLESIEMLADELRLMECSIILHSIEEHDVRDVLAKQMTADVWRVEPFSNEISRYLLGGNGMGFPLHIANRVHELDEAGDDEREDDMGENGDDDGDNGNEMSAEEFLRNVEWYKHSPTNRIVASPWQASPF
jgi:hypothetical protein